MQNETPFSLMVWEDVSNLPFPKEISAIIHNIKWSEYQWHVIGLPMPHAKYSMSCGQNLYLSELPDGTTKVENLSDFTGKIAIGGYFVDEENIDGYNYFITFIVTLIHGTVSEIEVDGIKKQPLEEYNNAINTFRRDIIRIEKMSQSFWFKWLYRPWFYTVRGLGYVFLTILKCFKVAIIWIVNKLTPL
jgi:hypothetical protein